MIDLWGNVSPVQKVPGKEGLVAAARGPDADLLADIDGQLMQTRASVLDRLLIESSFQPHTRKLRFTNNYRNAIGGTVRLKPPPGWGINPPTFTFSLNPGETFDREITLELPYNSVAGPKAIGRTLCVAGRRDRRLHRADHGEPGPERRRHADDRRTGWERPDRAADDHELRRQADRLHRVRRLPRAVAAGTPDQRTSAGKTTIRRYKFPSVDFKVGGKVRAGVKEMVGTRILNDEVAVQ